MKKNFNKSADDRVHGRVVISDGILCNKELLRNLGKSDYKQFEEIIKGEFADEYKEKGAIHEPSKTLKKVYSGIKGTRSFKK